MWFLPPLWQKLWTGNNELDVFAVFIVLLLSGHVYMDLPLFSNLDYISCCSSPPRHIFSLKYVKSLWTLILKL